MPISFRSKRVLKESFVLSLIIIVPITLSNIFLTTCITSKLWRNKSVFQYGNSKKVLCFFQLWSCPCPSRNCFFRPLPNIIGFNGRIYFNTSSPDNYLGAVFLSFVPLNCVFLLRHLWSKAKKWRCIAYLIFIS